MCRMRPGGLPDAEQTPPAWSSCRVWGSCRPGAVVGGPRQAPGSQEVQGDRMGRGPPSHLAHTARRVHIEGTPRKERGLHSLAVAFGQLWARAWRQKRVLARPECVGGELDPALSLHSSQATGHSPQCSFPAMGPRGLDFLHVL